MSIEPTITVVIQISSRGKKQDIISLPLSSLDVKELQNVIGEKFSFNGIVGSSPIYDIVREYVGVRENDIIYPNPIISNWHCKQLDLIFMSSVAYQKMYPFEQYKIIALVTHKPKRVLQNHIRSIRLRRSLRSK